MRRSLKFFGVPAIKIASNPLTQRNVLIYWFSAPNPSSKKLSAFISRGTRTRRIEFTPRTTRRISASDTFSYPLILPHGVDGIGGGCTVLTPVGPETTIVDSLQPTGATSCIASLVYLTISTARCCLLLSAALSARHSRVTHQGTLLRSSISLPLSAHRQKALSPVGSSGVVLTHRLCQTLVGTSNGQKYAVNGCATWYFVSFDSVMRQTSVSPLSIIQIHGFLFL